MEEKKNEVKKIIPSRLETGLQKFLYRTIGVHIPQSVTPNQVTLLGALGGLVGIICAFLARINSLFLIGTIIGLCCLLICFVLDGYVARSRNMTSLAGGYFDLLTDILHITYLIIALAVSGFVSFPIAICLVPVYALLMFTAMNYIMYLKEFLFPRLGPIETHMVFVIVCIGSMICGKESVLAVLGIGLKFADIVFLLGGIPMYYEMIRLQIQLYSRLRRKDYENKQQ